MHLPLTGGCQCGAIRYEVHGRPERVHICHCRMCQKAMGNAFAALAPIRRADFRLVCGEFRHFRSSSAARRGFCADCGTPLSYEADGSDWLCLSLGSFDEPARLPPAQQLGVESTLPWFAGLHHLPGVRTEADNADDESWGKLVNYQHADAPD